MSKGNRPRTKAEPFHCRLTIPKEPTLRKAGCDVIPAYRDQRVLQKCEFGAGSNVKKGQKDAIR